jgi:hypothetical protein
MRKSKFAASLFQRGILVNMDVSETLTVSHPDEFRSWLEQNCRTKKEIWLVIYKKASGRSIIAYDQAVEAALCFGWIDGMMKSLDAEALCPALHPAPPGQSLDGGQPYQSPPAARRGQDDRGRQGRPAARF